MNKRTFLKSSLVLLCLLVILLPIISIAQSSYKGGYVEVVYVGGMSSYHFDHVFINDSFRLNKLNGETDVDTNLLTPDIITPNGKWLILDRRIIFTHSGDTGYYAINGKSLSVISSYIKHRNGNTADTSNLNFVAVTRDGDQQVVQFIHSGSEATRFFKHFVKILKRNKNDRRVIEIIDAALKHARNHIEDV